LRPFRAPAAISVELGTRTFDVTTRALVMGVLNRTTDSFFAPAATFDLDELLKRAAALVDDGADVLDVGGVRAGPGVEIDEAEELERVIPVIEALCDRFDVAVSVDTWRAAVAKASFAAGAVLGNDISGFADPEYLGVAAAAGASVVATHIRLRPRVADPEPVYDDVVATVASFLEDRAASAVAAGIPARRVIVDAGLDLGKTPEQSLDLLRASGILAAASPHALLLSASNKRFLGALLGLEIDERHDASLAACALGATLGCRVLRVHDVRGTVRVRDAIASMLEAA
jgi:dihydropteroate synthase